MIIYIRLRAVTAPSTPHLYDNNNIRNNNIHKQIRPFASIKILLITYRRQYWVFCFPKTYIWSPSIFHLQQAKLATSSTIHLLPAYYTTQYAPHKSSLEIQMIRINPHAFHQQNKIFVKKKTNKDIRFQSRRVKHFNAYCIETTNSNSEVRLILSLSF